MIRRPCTYNLPTETLRQCWIAYAGRPAGYCMVASSDIIVVAQEPEVVRCARVHRRAPGDVAPQKPADMKDMPQ